MPSTEVHEFRLTDRDGTEHAYTLALHDAMAGAKLTAALTAAAAEPIAALAPLAEGGLDRAWTEVLRDLDPTSIGRAVRDAIASLDTDRVLPELFRHVLRDDKKLSDSGAFNAAYRGNYGELYRAAWEIVRANGFFPLSDMLRG